VHTQYALHFAADTNLVAGVSAVERAITTGRQAVATSSAAALSSLQLVYNAAKPGSSTALQLSTTQINAKIALSVSRSLAKAV
jgi:hypothetical protein